MNVIQDEKCPGFKMGVKAVVFEIRERICMWAINDSKLQLFVEMVLRERTLGWAFYKRNNAFS